jgi:TatD DNase family protein
MSLVDSHCHLTHERFDEDRIEVLGRAARAGVSSVVSIASELTDADRIAETLVGTWEGVRVFGTAGVHPHEVGRLPDPEHDPGAAREVLDRLRELVARPGIVAVGECGLDFHYDFAPRDAQLRWFDAQLRLAGEVGRPVVVHCREAEADMIPRVREAGEAGVRGVLHCFPGDLELLGTAMDAGWCVSFTGNVTFRRFDGTRAVQEVPKGRYFLETDGPYLAPVPHRGKRNEPAFVALVRDRVAELRGVTPTEIETETTTAVEGFFSLAAAGAPAEARGGGDQAT